MAFPSGYNRYQEVTILAAQIGATETDFPVLLTEANFVKAGDDIFDTVRTDGGDIRITLSDGTTQIAREVVPGSFDKSSKTMELHVKNPSLSSSVDTIVRVWYNGIDAEPAIDSTYGSENVWVRSSGHTYGAVQHMNDTTASTVTDSTANDNDGTKKAANEPIETTGLLAGGTAGKSQDSDGLNDNISIPTDPAIDFADEPFFTSLWFEADSLPNAFNYLYSKNFGGGGVKWDGMWVTNAGNFSAQLDDGTNIALPTQNSGVSTGVRYLAHIVRDTASNLARLYKNGTQVSSASESAVGSISNTGSLVMCNRADIGTGRIWNGKIDEVRRGAGTISADWILTEYNNQSSPSTFYSVSDEQTTGATLLPNKLNQDQSLDNIDLVQQHVLSIDPLNQTQSIDDIDLTQVNILVINGTGQAQTLGNLDLQAGVSLVIDPTDQSQTIDNIDLAQAHALVVSRIDQAQAVDNIALSAGVVLQIADMAQAQNIDVVNLIQQNTLSVNPLDQGQTLEQITLDTGVILGIADIIQNQTLEQLDLTQVRILAIDAIAQGQVIDNVVFSQVEGKIIITLTLRSPNTDLSIRKPSIDLSIN